MKVLHLQYGSSSSGNYTITLHELMLANGINSSVLSLFSNFIPKDPSIKWLGKIPNFKAGIDFKIQKYLNRKNHVEYGDFSYPIFGTDISNHVSVSSADVIYVHWILNGFLNLKSLSRLAELGKPMVFVLHDMWTFTGGCHHSFSCEKFTASCGNCPVLDGQKEKDRSYKLFKRKEKFFLNKPLLYFVAPSEWMLDRAKASNLLKGKDIRNIFNSVSEHIKEKKERSGKFIPIGYSKRIIGFGANDLMSPYKGFTFLLEALQILNRTEGLEGCEVLVFGGNVPMNVTQAIPFKVNFTGFLTSEHDINEAFNSMDVFIIPSLADNLPTTVLESLKCGVPVVGFQTGGIPEIIDHLKNGYLVPKYDAQGLAEGILYCLNSKIRGYLKSEFASSTIIQGHKSLLRQILSKAV
jgi:glycosyltransferase involved in cell wall biosynthesis